MKKSLFLITLFLAFMYPVMAQVAQDLTESIPEESLTLKKGNIPPQIIAAAEKLFQGSTQIAWGVFPYELKDYGWVVDKNYNDPINHYEIHLKATDGSDVMAVFESTGELISYRLVKKDAVLPAAITAALAKGPYKDWKISGDVMLIKKSQKKVVDHYAVNVINGNQKKTLYFSMLGDVLTNK